MSSALVLHITSGTVGLLAGGVAMSFAKGSRPHRLAGDVFVASMLTLAATGALLGALKSQPTNVLGGAFTFYLVATGWDTARRTDERPSLFDWCALTVVSAAVASYVIFGVEAMQSADGMKAGVPAAMYLLMGAVAVLALVGDVRMLVRGISGTRRTVRHLWRMCFGWFIASGSIFLARPHLFPAILRKSYLIFLLGVLPLLLMIFWVARISFARAEKKTPALPRAGGVYTVRA